MIPVTVPTDKKSLRAECLAARQNISARVAQEAARKLAVHLLKAIPVPGIVAVYLAIRGEIDLSDAFAQFSERKQTLCLPVIVRDNAPLAFRRWQPGAALEKGKYGIDIPLSTEPPVIPDIIIVPLLAFDKTGHRLGYGAGFYDLTIRKLREAQKNVKIIGAAYSMQQVEHIPSEPHDEKLDMVVTEKEIIVMPAKAGIQSF